MPVAPLFRAPLVLALALLATPIGAQEATATVDRNEVRIGEPVLLTVTVPGREASEPRLPELPAFRVRYHGQASSMQSINGRMSTSLSYRFVLVPLEVGRHRIGAIEVPIGDTTVLTRPFQVRVLAADADVPRQRDLWLEVTVSNREPYVGEQVAYTWRFYRRVSVADAQLTSLEFGDLVVEDLGEAREYDTTVDGVQYRVSEIRKALFAQRPGRAVIPPSQLVCEVVVQSRRRRSLFDLGRSTETQTLRSRPLELEVRSLPAAPAEFSGLVGRFDLSASLSKERVRVGESVTLEVVLSGAGNVQMGSAPQLPELMAFKVYEDRPTLDLDRSGSRLAGRRVFRRALVPLEVGSAEIPPARIVTFDPEAGTYRTAETAGLVLDVLPSEDREELMLTESVAPTTGKVAVRILADDILPIRRGLDAARPAFAASWGPGRWSAALLLPPALCLGLLLGGRWRRLRGDDSPSRRRARARRSAERRLRALEESARDGGLAPAGARCLEEYLRDRGGLGADERQAGAVEAALLERGVDEALARRCRELLERFDATRFGGRPLGMTPEQARSALRPILADLERQL